MEEWLSDYRAWFEEEDENEAFAQTLLREFSNWFPTERVLSRGLTREDISNILGSLHFKVQSVITDRIRQDENCAFAQTLCQEFANWDTEAEEYVKFATVLCQDFANWKTEEEEFQEFGDKFLTENFEELPRDIIREVRKKGWTKQTRKEVPFGLAHAPRVFSRYWNDRYFQQFHSYG